MPYLIALVAASIGFFSALALFYASTDAPGKVTFRTDDLRFDAGVRRRKNIGKAGLILLAVAFLLQIVAMTIPLRP